MATVKTKWWGVFVKLDRTETCRVTSVHDLAGGAVSIFVGGPWGALIAVAIGAQKDWIRSSVGTNGVKLKIAWTGNLFSVKRRGSISNCPFIPFTE